MAFRSDILTPIGGDNPAGIFLKRDPIYAEIRDLTLEEEDLPQGDFKRERKVADWPRVSELCQQLLAEKSKDLQLAAWLCLAALNRDGLPGLAAGLELIESLLLTFWTSLYPPLDDGDAARRVVPLRQLSKDLPLSVSQTALTLSEFSFLDYKGSRDVGYEQDAQSKAQRDAREQKLTEGKLDPVTVDKAVEESPKSFYAALDKGLTDSIARLDSLKNLADEKFAAYAPNWGPLRAVLMEIRKVVAPILKAKREQEPDPPEALEPQPGVPGTSGTTTPHPEQTGFIFSTFTGSEPPETRELIERIAGAAAQLRRQDSFSPAPYLMLRGLRFGELRAAAYKGDLKQLEAPPTEIRRLLKINSIEGKWKNLLELTESAMALPCSRAWLDLQRLTVSACTHLGEQYGAIATAVASEVSLLIADLPELRHMTLLDDTPTANQETQAWLDQLQGSAGAAQSNGGSTTAARWNALMARTSSRAADLMRNGDSSKAVAAMRSEMDSQRSGRGRFETRIELIEMLCGPAASPDVAQPLIEQMSEELEQYKLEEWENREFIVRALVVLYRHSTKLADDETDRRALFERICRLDPAQAIALR